MGMNLGASGKRAMTRPEINVTPLVDVVLVLLIIFMVVAPAINEGETVDLPKIFQADPKPKDMNPIDLTIALNGRVLLDKAPITKAELRQRLEGLHRENPERELLLKTDYKLPYREVRALLADLQGIGFRGLSLKVVERKPAGAGS